MEQSLVKFVIGEEPPARLDKALARDVPEEAALSRSRLSRLLESGAVAIDGTVVTDAKAKVREGAEVEITVEIAEDYHVQPEDIPLTVLYEDNDLIVVDKPAGMVVHPAPGSRSGTLVNALLHHCGDTLSGVGGEKRPGIVHRIDKETSGLLVIAKTDRAHHGLAEQFEKHTVERHYLALCYGVPHISDPRIHGVKGTSFEQGSILKIQTRLDRHRTDRQRQAVCWEGGRHAVTRARVVEEFGTPSAISLVDCWLETGRTHQIRVHMAHVGHSLVGDPVYGSKRKLSAKALSPEVIAQVAAFARQGLHAATLGFKHPVTGEMMRFEAEIPADMAALIEALRG